jgi:hypothetical protein
MSHPCSHCATPFPHNHESLCFSPLSFFQHSLILYLHVRRSADGYPSSLMTEAHDFDAKLLTGEHEPEHEQRDGDPPEPSDLRVAAEAPCTVHDDPPVQPIDFKSKVAAVDLDGDRDPTSTSMSAPPPPRAAPGPVLVETNARPGEQPRTFEVGALVAEGGQGIVHEVTEMKDGVPQPGPPLGTGLVVKLLRRLPHETRDPQGPWEAQVLHHLQLGLGCPYIVPAPIVATRKQRGRGGDLGLVFPRLRGKSNWLEC